MLAQDCIVEERRLKLLCWFVSVARNPTSVWSTVPRLALCEKGYADSAFNLVEVGLIFS